MTRKKAIYVWWHYHWYLLLIAVAAIGLLIWILYSQFSQKKPDYRIGLVALEDLPVDTAETLVRELEPYCEDVNGDGQVLIELNQYTVDFDTANEDTNAYSQMSGVIKMSANLNEDDCCDIFFFTDPAGFAKNTEILRYLDGSVPETEAEYEDWEKMCYAWSDCPVLTGLDLGQYRGYTLMDNEIGESQDVMSKFYIGRRILRTEKQEKNSVADEKLWDKLTEGATAISE